MNAGGYGSEFHKLRVDGLDDSLAVFGRPALEKIARGFDLRGHEIRNVSVIPKLFADFAAQGEKGGLCNHIRRTDIVRTQWSNLLPPPIGSKFFKSPICLSGASPLVAAVPAAASQ